MLVDIRDYCIWMHTRKRTRPLKKEANKFVLFVRFDELGDLIVWLPYAAMNLAMLPDYKSVLAVNHLWADFAQSTKLFSEIIPVKVRHFRRNRAYRKSVISNLSSRYWSIIINPCRTRWQRFADAEALIHACHADKIIGFDNSEEGGWRSRLAAPMYDLLIPPIPGPATPEWYQYQQLLSHQGVHPPPLLSPTLASKYPLPKGFDATIPYILLAPGAGSPQRCWPADYYAEVANKVKSRYGIRVVICGSPSDSKSCAAVAQKITSAENLTGITSVREFAGVIQHAKVVLTNESAAAHLSAATGAPCVCITGGGHFNRFMPYPQRMQAESRLPIAVFNKMKCYNCNWFCLHKTPPHQPFPCITSITPDAVWQATESLLQCSTERF